MPMSLDHESAPACPGPQPRQPDGWMGRRPRPLFPTAAVHDRAAARGRVGGRNEIGARPSHSSAGLAPRRHPKSTRPPPDRGPPRRRNRPTTRPGREPCLTGLSLGGDEPAVFRMATAPGTNEYRDRPGLVPRHSRLAPRSGAAGVRMRVGCGSSSAWGPGVASALDSQAGSPTDGLRRRCCDPGEKASKKRQKPRGRGKYFLLTARTLEGV